MEDEGNLTVQNPSGRQPLGRRVECWDPGIQDPNSNPPPYTVPGTPRNTWREEVNYRNTGGG